MPHTVVYSITVTWPQQKWFEGLDRKLGQEAVTDQGTQIRMKIRVRNKNTFNFPTLGEFAWF